MQPIAPLGLLLALAPLTTASAQTTPWSAGSLSQPRGDLGGTAVNELMLFAGGRSGGTLHDAVDIHDASTGMWSIEFLSVPRTFVIGSTVGDFAMFSGGSSAIGAGTDLIDVFDAATWTWSTAALSEPKVGHATTTVGTKVLFAGGSHIGVPSANVDIYDASVGPPSDPAAWSTATLSAPRLNLVGVTVGDLAMFAGGHDFSTGRADVDIYDDSTGLWSTATLSLARGFGPHSAVAVGTRAYFAGGLLPPGSATPVSDIVDIYDATLGLPGDPTAWSTATLSVARGLVCAAAVGNTIHFAGGAQAMGVPSNVIDTLNVTTGQWDAMYSLSQARVGSAVASIGGKAMFAGGFGMAGPSAVVDVLEPVGVNYCLPTANSTGLVATISAEGSSSITANDLTLRATSLPANTFGYFLASRIRGAVANPGSSQGHLCLGGTIGRYIGAGQVLNSGVAGEFSLLVDLNAMPTPTGLVPAQSGETWHFQTWYRDSGSSNFTDAVSVVPL